MSLLCNRRGIRACGQCLEPEDGVGRLSEVELPDLADNIPARSSADAFHGRQGRLIDDRKVGRRRQTGLPCQRRLKRRAPCDGAESISEASRRERLGQMPVGVSYKYYTLPIVNLNISDEQVKDIAKDLPSVKAQRSLVDSTITKVELLKQRQYGVISGQYSFSGGETAVAGYSRQNTFSIEYNVQVFDGFKARSAISEAALESYEQVLELDQIQRDQVLALANAKSRFDSSRETLKNRVDLLKSTRAVDAGTRELFTLSRASITDVFREQEAHFSAASQVIDAVFLRDISVYQYLHVLDRLLPTFELEI